MVRPITLTAVLFAGGQSRRMGRDKATLVIGGESLWARQLRVLRELSPTRSIVSSRARPDWAPADAQVVLDAEPSRGPLSGLAAALADITTTHLLALAVDLPRMTSAHLHALLALAEPGCGVVPVREDRFEPLCAIYPKEAAGYCAAALASRDYSLQSFARTLAAHSLLHQYALSPPESALYLNVNSPGDLPSLET